VNKKRIYSEEWKEAAWLWRNFGKQINKNSLWMY